MFLSKRKRQSQQPDIRTAEGFTTFYNTYFKFVFEICDRYIHNDNISQNVTCEIFASLWERREEIFEQSLEENFWERYLTKATKYKIYDHFRIQERVQRYMSNATKELSPYQNTTEVDLNYHELAEQVDELVGKLPPRCKEVYQLSRVDGLSHREIAQHMSITMAGVNKHISRALHYLKENLTDYHISTRSTGT
ncbi:MAG: sigma-70 family RNA polymerase sigma factor [Bacteroidota bacterium]